MTTPSDRRRTVHVHIGPHKTGSTAIQHVLNAHGDEIKAQLGITALTHRCVRDLAQALGREDEAQTDSAMAELARRCAAVKGDVLISSEDLAGDLPGRTGKRRVYPRLWMHLNTIRKGLPGFDVKFYFFKRDPDAWLRSAYIQLLKHRGKFRSFDGYVSFLNNLDEVWDGTLTRARNRLGDDLVEIEYLDTRGFSATQALFNAIAPGRALVLPDAEPRPNTSPSPEIVSILETINGAGASNHAMHLAKTVLLAAEPMREPRAESQGRFPEWPPKMVQPTWLAPELEPLWSRTEARTKHQLQPNLMPPLDCDLTPFRTRLVQADEAFPEGGRHHMENQTRILAYRFKGKPEICYLQALCISYLRRNTDCTEHAAQLFQRLWAEEYPVLLGVLPTRWLISTFQTFADHGANEAQRQIGTAAFFLSNTLKLYEAERALDGLPPERPYPSETPTTKSGFAGLDRFRVGGTDLMLNTNALLLELASRDDIAGRVVQEFMLRMKRSHTAFSRMDASRVAHDVDIPQFANCWSFFTPPKVKS